MSTPPPPHCYPADLSPSLSLMFMGLRTACPRAAGPFLSRSILHPQRPAQADPQTVLTEAVGGRRESVPWDTRSRSPRPPRAPRSKLARAPRLNWGCAGALVTPLAGLPQVATPQPILPMAQPKRGCCPVQAHLLNPDTPSQTPQHPGPGDGAEIWLSCLVPWRSVPQSPGHRSSTPPHHASSLPRPSHPCPAELALLHLPLSQLSLTLPLFSSLSSSPLPTSPCPGEGRPGDLQSPERSCLCRSTSGSLGRSGKPGRLSRTCSPAPLPPRPSSPFLPSSSHPPPVPPPFWSQYF